MKVFVQKIESFFPRHDWGVYISEAGEPGRCVGVVHGAKDARKIARMMERNGYTYNAARYELDHA